MTIVTTERLRLRQLVAQDAPFILELLNDPEFIRNVVDRQVRTVDAARDYILSGPVISYARHGFGLYCVELRESGQSIGICGLLRRDYLEHVDVGFALLPAFRGQGLALEAAAAVMTFGRDTLGLTRIVAITAPHNKASIGLLERLGLRFERMQPMPDAAPQTCLYG